MRVLNLVEWVELHVGWVWLLCGASWRVMIRLF